MDPSKAKTKIQIRFHDGTRKAQEFNEESSLQLFAAVCSFEGPHCGGLAHLLCPVCGWTGVKHLPLSQSVVRFRDQYNNIYNIYIFRYVYEVKGPRKV